MRNLVVNPFMQFNLPNIDRSAGLCRLYLGVKDAASPRLSQTQAYAVLPDGSELAIPQPITLSASGVPLFNGSPIQIRVEPSSYSMEVTTPLGAQLYYTPEVIAENEAPTDVVAPTLINVPADFPTIAAALASISDARIPVGSTCTIKVADGSYELSAGLLVNHPDGLRLRIVGNEINENLCTLTIPSFSTPSFDMITVSNGYQLGYINGFRITLPSKATNWTGILAVNGAFIYCGNKISVNNFYYGIAARVGSEVICDYAKVNNAGDVGIWAYVGSTVSCNYATSTNTSDPSRPLGFGIQAEFGSSVECTGASASGCKIAGIAALSNGLVRAHEANASNNTGSGFYASAGGHIENHNATANNNTRYGEERVSDGTIAGGGVTLTGNTLGAISLYAYLDNSASMGARIAANGDLRIDVNDANNVYFNSSGGAQAQIAHTSASNSWPILRGNASNQAGIEAGGVAANIDFNVRAKGTGRTFLNSNRANFVSTQGSDAGAGIASVRADGADTNADLLLAGKGTGTVRLGKHFAGTATNNGYIEFKLEDGAVVRINAQRV